MGKCISLMFAKISVDAADSHVHLGHFPGVGLSFLTIDSYGASASAVRLHEFCALNEHAT